ncbi:hypothetical protein [Archaeoglobus sulfaticallidus]|nr:hypothetical protein [Archaeoglobus sulfaticallidus]
MNDFTSVFIAVVVVMVSWLILFSLTYMKLKKLEKLIESKAEN